MRLLDLFAVLSKLQYAMLRAKDCQIQGVKLQVIQQALVDTQLFIRGFNRSSQQNYNLDYFTAA